MTEGSDPFYPPRIAADDPRLSTARPWTLRANELACLELFAGGALAPALTFYSGDTITTIVRDRAFPDGTPFSIPLVLRVDDSVKRGDVLALRNAEGVIFALCEISHVDLLPLTPGGPPERIAEGELSIVRLTRHVDFPELYRRPAETRARLAGRKSVAAVFLDRVLPRTLADRIAKLLAPNGPHDALLVLVPTPPIEPGDLEHHLTVRAIQAALAHLDPDADRSLLVLLPDPEGSRKGEAPRRSEPQRVFALQRVLAWNFGAHVLLGEDEECDRARRYESSCPRPGTWAFGAQPVALPAAEGKTLEHADVAALLARVNPPRSKQGFTVWLTGLSQSGKSTIATILSRLLLDHGRGSTLLDGDVVRTHLSKGLGFSREDRDVNIRRLGFVAAEITRHGGVAIVAAISPYRAIRAENRARIGNYVEVFVNAPITVCETRDQKGQYARARRGEITGFTGVDDPYEPPLPGDADHLECRTDGETPEQSAANVLSFLVRCGFVDPTDRLDAIDANDVAATPRPESGRT